jgi:long-subunit fatty acid transport protein
LSGGLSAFSIQLSVSFQFAQNAVETNAGTTTNSLKVQDTWHAALGAQCMYNDKTRVNAGIAYDSSFYKHQNQTMFALPSGATWRYVALWCGRAIPTVAEIGPRFCCGISAF